MTKKAILIIGHGSKSPANASAVKMHADILTDKGYNNVYYGFRAYSEPIIPHILETIIQDGADERIAVPLFMSHGYYADSSIPKKLGLEKGVSEGSVEMYGRSVTVHITDVFGCDPKMTDILLSEAERLNTDGKTSVVFLIGHGSKTSENHDMVKLNADRLKERRPGVYYSFNEFSSPTVEEALATMVSDGAEEALVLPLFVSSGGHTDKDLPEKLGIAEGSDTGSVNINGRVLTVRYAGPIGMNPGVNEIIESLIRPFL
jgi:sirohydrochlorin cobaltochelatase